MNPRRRFSLSFKIVRKVSQSRSYRFFEIFTGEAIFTQASVKVEKRKNRQPWRGSILNITKESAHLRKRDVRVFNFLTLLRVER
jgi:hypothetical protein